MESKIIKIGDVLTTGIYLISDLFSGTPIRNNYSLLNKCSTVSEKKLF